MISRRPLIYDSPGREPEPKSSNLLRPCFMERLMRRGRIAKDEDIPISSTKTRKLRKNSMESSKSDQLFLLSNTNLANSSESFRDPRLGSSISLCRGQKPALSPTEQPLTSSMTCLNSSDSKYRGMPVLRSASTSPLSRSGSCSSQTYGKMDNAHGGYRYPNTQQIKSNHRLNESFKEQFDTNLKYKYMMAQQRESQNNKLHAQYGPPRRRFSALQVRSINQQTTANVTAHTFRDTNGYGRSDILMSSGRPAFRSAGKSPSLSINTDLIRNGRHSAHASPGISTPTRTMATQYQKLNTQYTSTEISPSESDPKLKPCLRRVPRVHFLDQARLTSNSAFVETANQHTMLGHSRLENCLDNPQARCLPKAKRSIGKVFVICCQCVLWHDLPSYLYKSMTEPERELNNDSARHYRLHDINNNTIDTWKQHTTQEIMYRKNKITCPYCSHLMSTSCCASWTTIVFLHERHR